MGYLSSATREAAVKYEKEGTRTIDLEKKVFGAEFGGSGARVQQLEREVSAYEQRVTNISLEQYAGLARLALGALEAFGLPATTWAMQSRVKRLEQVEGALQSKRKGYDVDIQQRQRAINRQYEVRDVARVLTERYQNMLTDIKAALVEEKAQHTENMQEAAQRDNKAYLASAMQLSNLRTDYEQTSEHLRAVLLKLDQAAASARMLEGIQTQMYALRQRVHKSELRVRRVLEHARIMDSREKLSIPAAVSDIAAAEISGSAVHARTLAVEDATWDIVEKIHSYESAEDQQQDQERQDALRAAVAEEDDRLLQQALDIQ